MDVINIENKRTDLKTVLSSSSSPREKVLAVAGYFNLLLESGDNSIIESYITEFIESFIFYLGSYSPAGVNPSVTENLLAVCNKLATLDCLNPFKQQINFAVDNVKAELNRLRQSLSGETGHLITDGRFYIPVIEETTGEGGLNLGLLESISVSLKKSKDKGKFVIVPSGKELEQRLIGQVKNSWNIALIESNRYLKRKKFDEVDVIISFDKRYGYYTGDSLGTALTVLFLEEILNYYNSPIVISKNSIAALTGGIDEEGNIKPVSGEIIKQKTGIVFFSDTGLFVLPKDDEQTARNELGHLKSLYPNRNLKIESIESFSDLLNRRNIVDIRKQKTLVRTAKFALRNWAAVFLFAAILLLIYIGRFYDFDTNPAQLVNKGSWLFVENKNGKLLWKRKVEYNLDTEKLTSSLLKTSSQKLVDVNGDGINEVILLREDAQMYNDVIPRQVSCLDSDGNIIWYYIFRDTIETNEMVHSTDYGSSLVDTLTILNKKALMLYSNNVLYPSAIYFLELETGKRFGPTMWNPGHLRTGLIGDFDENGKAELVGLGTSNCFERVALFSIDIDNIGGQFPSKGPYFFVGKEFAKINKYILLPKSDVNKYLGYRFNTFPVNISYIENPKYFTFHTSEDPDKLRLGIHYRFDNKLNFIMLDPDDFFQVARDSLVARGELEPPYTKTREYKEILGNNMLFWNGIKFVTKKE